MLFMPSKALRFIIVFIVIMLTALSAVFLLAYFKRSDGMLHVEASTTIQAPRTRVVEIYQDYYNWPSLFPTIKAVRLIREEPGKKVLEIDHAEGRVINILTIISPEEVVLEEFKKKYDGKFVNRFEAVPEGTRLTVAADISLKGFYKLLAPFLHNYIRKQITVFVLDPIKNFAEDPAKKKSGG
jgi:Polyketide cyclase / dehydrase and lipid transport